MIVDQVDFNFGASLIAGILGSAVAVLALSLWEWRRDEDRTLRITELIGSAFPVSGSGAVAVGWTCSLLIGCAYGVFLGASIFGFDVTSRFIVAGIVISFPLWIVSGVTLAYARLLHRLVRNGRIQHPGPFALSRSREAAVEFLAAHLVFGAVAGGIYGWLA